MCRPAGARARIDQLLRRVGLADAADRPFRTYSAGMRQKLAIARGLLGDAAGAVHGRADAARSTRSRRARCARLVAEYIVGELGRTVILATHSMAEAEELCDRLALIRAGRVVGPGHGRRAAPALPYGVRCELRLRRSARPSCPTRLRRLPGVLELDMAREGMAAVLDLAMSAEVRWRHVLREVVETVPRSHALHGVAEAISSRTLLRARAGDGPAGARQPPMPRRSRA